MLLIPAIAAFVIDGQEKGQQPDWQEELTAKALKYIVASQKEDGSWPGRDTIYITSLNCLALYSSGSTTNEGTYKKELQRGRDFILTKIENGTRDLVGGAVITAPLVTMFLSHLYAMGKSDDVKKLIEKQRDYMVKRQRAEGGWIYDSAPGGFHAGGQPFLTNNIVISLLLMKELGIDVDGKVFENVGKFYTQKKFQDVSKGGLPYG
jgi:hypothetical protein